MCSYQNLSYTIAISEESRLMTTLSQFTHTGPGIVEHNVGSELEQDHEYSIQLTVTTSSGNVSTNISLSKLKY